LGHAILRDRHRDWVLVEIARTEHLEQMSIPVLSYPVRAALISQERLVAPWLTQHSARFVEVAHE
jgi:hypothetical protein